MDLNTIQTVISTLGFPIVCVLFLGWFIWKIWINQQEQNKTREEKLYSFINKAEEIKSQLVTVLNSYKSDLETIKADVTEIKENMKG